MNKNKGDACKTMAIDTLEEKDKVVLVLIMCRAVIKAKDVKLPIVKVINTLKLLLLLAITSLTACSTTYINNGQSFDVAGGRYIAYIDKKITGEGWLRCESFAKSNPNNTEWLPAIIVSIKDGENNFISRVNYSPQASVHTFLIETLENEEYTYVKEFMRLNRTNKTVLFGVAWSNDGTIGYFAGDSSGQESSGSFYNPNQFYETLAVTISGVKGQIFCSGEGF